MRANVCVDALNVHYGCLRGSPYKWLDLDALSRRYLRPSDELNRIRYFTARVSPHSRTHAHRGDSRPTYVRSRRSRA